MIKRDRHTQFSFFSLKVLTRSWSGFFTYTLEILTFLSASSMFINYVLHTQRGKDVYI